MEKPKVGQVLYELNIGNAAQYRQQKLTPVEVVKVGVKYFTCRPIGKTGMWQETKYHLTDWREKTDYSPASKLYVSETAYQEECEGNIICRDICKMFGYDWYAKRVSFIDLKKIDEILKPYKERTGSET